MKNYTIFINNDFNLKKNYTISKMIFSEYNGFINIKWAFL